MRKPMSAEHRLKLKKNYVTLSNDMQTEYLLPYFIQEGVLTLSMADEIKGCSTNFQMNDKLLQMLPYRGDGSYRTLCDSLRYGSGQLHLVEILEETKLSTHEIAELEESVCRQTTPNIYLSDSEYDDDGIVEEEIVRVKSKYTVRSTSRNKSTKFSVGDKGKKKLKRRKIQKNHTEQLPGVSHLFPYVTPHIHSKWKRLGLELGLEDSDLNCVVELPHEKQSKYAQLVLNIWMNKDKTKATKKRLTDALQKLHLRKALNAIAIYEVPKQKTGFSKKPSTSSLNSYNATKTKTQQNYYNSDHTEESEHEIPRVIKLNLTERKSGYLPIKCEIRKISETVESHSQGTSQISETVESHSQGTSQKNTQQKFLSMADRIMTTMIDKGEDTTHILNTMERLQGIVFCGVRRGSIIIEVQVLYLLALERLMQLYASKQLIDLLETVLVTTDLLQQYNLSQVSLQVTIAQEDYQLCRDDLLHLKSSPRDSAAESSVDLYSSDSSANLTDCSDMELELSDPFDHLISETTDNIRSLTTQINILIEELSNHSSELLMTLQIIHPPTIRQIESLDDLYMFRRFIEQADRSSLSVNSVDSYINTHTAVRHRIEETRRKLQQSLDKLAAYNKTPKLSMLHSSCDKLIELERMFSNQFNFSGLSHPNSVQMTTLELLGYRGLFSLFLVGLEKIKDIEMKLSSPEERPNSRVPIFTL